MKVKQLRYLTDNFSYVIHGKSQAAVIDGGAVDEILAFVEKKGLELVYAANTHAHYDHTTGTKDLLDGSNARYLENKTLLKKGGFEIDGHPVAVHATPGHTDDSVVFHTKNLLISGDTLFNGTVGNCFSGDLKRFYESIRMLMGFSQETIVYAGHDYVQESLMFAKLLEPDNKNIDLFLENYDPGHVCSTLAEELSINPYLRFNEPAIVAFLEKKGLPVGTEYERWESLMSIE
jgi:hydroxyacylglutathione hydrolase